MSKSLTNPKLRTVYGIDCENDNESVKALRDETSRDIDSTRVPQLQPCMPLVLKRESMAVGSLPKGLETLSSNAQGGGFFLRSRSPISKDEAWPTTMRDEDELFPLATDSLLLNPVSSSDTQTILSPETLTRKYGQPVAPRLLSTALVGQARTPLRNPITHSLRECGEAEGSTARSKARVIVSPNSPALGILDNDRSRSNDSITEIANKMRPRMSAQDLYLADYAWRHGLDGSNVWQHEQSSASQPSTVRTSNGIPDRFQTIAPSRTEVNSQTIYNRSIGTIGDHRRALQHTVRQKRMLPEETIAHPSGNLTPVVEAFDSPNPSFAHRMRDQYLPLEDHVMPLCPTSYPSNPHNGVEGSMIHPQRSPKVQETEGVGSALTGLSQAPDLQSCHLDDTKSLFRNMSWQEQTEFNPSPHTSPNPSFVDTMHECAVSWSNSPLSRRDHQASPISQLPPLQDRAMPALPLPKRISSFTAREARMSDQHAIHALGHVDGLRQFVLDSSQLSLLNISNRAKGRILDGILIENDLPQEHQSYITETQRQPAPHVQGMSPAHSAPPARRPEALSTQDHPRCGHMLPQRPEVIVATGAAVQPVQRVTLDNEKELPWPLPMKVDSPRVITPPRPRIPLPPHPLTDAPRHRPLHRTRPAQTNVDVLHQSQQDSTGPSRI